MSMPLVFVPQSELYRLRPNLPAFTAACRLNVLSMIAEAGSGHLGASFSSLDILVELLCNQMAPDDVLIMSRGHEFPAWIAIQVGLGNKPEAALHALRKPRGLPGHPTVDVPGVACNTGSLGMGISKAKGMILADRLLGVKRRYFVLLGDGELQEGQIAEALYGGIGHWPELVPIVDANGFQSDDLTLPRVLSLPGLCIRRTIKGKGVSFMEHNPRWHSGAPNEQEYEFAVAELVTALAQVTHGDYNTVRIDHDWLPPKPPHPLIMAYRESLEKLGEQNERIVVLDADLAKDCGLLSFKARFPSRFIECGIAEQDMVTMASGLALRGFIPIVHSFAAFLVRRAADQIYNQTTEHTRVIYVGTMAGALPETGPGKSHEITTDFGIMRQLGVKHAGSLIGDAKQMLRQLVKATKLSGSSYFAIPQMVAQ